jgi:hypothetical protein
MVPFRYGKEVIAVLIIVVAVLALYYTFQPVTCTDIVCYQERMKQCSPATFVNEDDHASWGYRILGTTEQTCEISVTLLNAKEGDVDLRRFEGSSMKCYYDIGVAGYPEKNLAACHGILKEGLQTIVIEKLYKYVVANLKDIRQDLLFSYSDY